MKIIKDNVIYETDNNFVIEQMLKHGAKEYKEPVKEVAKLKSK